MTDGCPVPKRPSLSHHLYAVSRVDDDLRHLIIAIATAVKYVSYAIQTTESGLAGTRNEFGEEQLKLDVLSDGIIRQYLCESRLVCSYASEETSGVVELTTKAPFTVVFDPLDGSSLVGLNFAIGSIFGIYRGGAIIGRKPQDQAAALYALYGPRTILVYSSGNGVHEFILNDVGEFILLRSNLGIGDDAKTFSPGNLQGIKTNSGYRAVIDSWFERSLKLRYSGCLVADVHHILSAGQGVFTYVGDAKNPQGKLRLVFECGPFAYLVHQAGGAASDGMHVLLERPIEALSQCTPIVIGSTHEVQRVCELLQSQ